MRKLVYSLAVVAVCTGSAWATVDISSPDGMWVATVEGNVGSEAGRIGQATNLRINGTDTLFESLHYLSINGAGSVRVEGNWTNTAWNNDAHSFTGSMTNGVLDIDVAGTMLSGPSGGLQLDFTYTNISSTAVRVKPFYYVDYDVAGAGGNTANQLGNGWEQSNSGITVWAIGKGTIKSMELQPFPSTRDWLDGGASQLRDLFDPGPNDLAGAIAWDEVSLEPGQSFSVSYGLGGPGIPEPATLSLLALGGLALLRRR